MRIAGRRRLGWVLSGLFALSMLMGAGPGVLLVNRPEPLLGLPALCTWGLCWYLVQAAVAVLAYRYLWHDEDRRDTAGVAEPADGRRPHQ